MTRADSVPECLVVDLGRVDYGDALELQQTVHAARVAGDMQDTLLLVEHPPTITMGRGADAAHLLAPPDRLFELGIEVHEIARGGDVTFHGPGQLVAYPVIDLATYRGDLGRYLRDLEETVIRCLAGFGLAGRRVEGLTGVFVGEGKIAAIGVQVRRWVSLHGLALNVTTDLSFYSHIVPCGISDRPVTSMAEHLDDTPSLGEAGRAVAESFGQVFGRRLAWGVIPPQVTSDYRPKPMGTTSRHTK
jgi:lipoyl(octanoyl) transferase